jgi:endoglucanase
MKELLKELTDTPGVSGDESRVRNLIESKIADHADSIETDNFGNLIARKGSGEKKLMLDAHMDQIGLGVRRLDDEGFIRISGIGGIYPVCIANQRVTVHTSEGDDVTGVIGVKPTHLMKNGKDEDFPEMRKMHVDVGAEDADDLHEMGVRVGDFISYDRKFKELQNGFVTAPGLDDRIGCAIVIEAFKRFDRDDYELVAVFSAQEEVGRKGARTAAYKEDPDVAVALETSQAGGVPHVDPDESDELAGEGFGITMIEAGGRGVITPEPVKKWMLDTADSRNHEYQRKMYDRGRTNASVINLAREGVPSGVVAVPVRNIHSPIETAQMTDIESAVEFVDDLFDSFTDHF